MKTTIIAIKNAKDNAFLDVESCVVSALNSIGVFVNEITVCDCDDISSFTRAYENKGEITVVLGKENCSFDFAAACGDIPFDGQGFHKDKTFVAVAPQNLNGYFNTFTDRIQDYLGRLTGKITFKLFGVTKSEVAAAANKITGEFPSVFFNVTSKYSDIRADLFYGESSPKMQVDAAIKSFITAFKDNIYAEDDVSLQQRFYDLLKLRRLTCSTAESMTGGRIASTIVEVSGASDIFYEGLVTYSTLAKERRLGVNHKTVVENTVVSSEVAYEMSLELLKYVDVAITITGYAGSDVHPDKDDGLCFIGIGVKDKTEVYRFKFDGTRKENIRSAANTAIYLALKTVENTEF